MLGSYQSGCWCVWVDHRRAGGPCGSFGGMFLSRGFLPLPDVGISKPSKSTSLTPDLWNWLSVAEECGLHDVIVFDRPLTPRSMKVSLTSPQGSS